MRRGRAQHRSEDFVVALSEYMDDYGVALTYALRDVMVRWESYRIRYERWQDGA